MSETRTKKQLGQHWLRDEESLLAMCEAAGVTHEDTVLEVGPGLGTLTEKLLQIGATVQAVEFDTDLIGGLQKRFGSNKKFSLQHQDIMRFDLSRLPKGYKVVANIPYYLTSNLLRRLHESDNQYSKAALLVQKEVAERVCAAPGRMSLLSVSVQYYAHVSLGRLVPAELFEPAPKVDSQILCLTRRQAPMFPDIDEKRFFRLVRAGYSERRKMLRSSLSGGLGISKTEAEELLTRAQIDPSRRPQTLSLDDWKSLYDAVL